MNLPALFRRFCFGGSGGNAGTKSGGKPSPAGKRTKAPAA